MLELTPPLNGQIHRKNRQKKMHRIKANEQKMLIFSDFRAKYVANQHKYMKYA